MPTMLTKDTVCATCWFSPGTPDVEKANKAHLKHDGAHTPNWQES
jgi:hypothetical protein